jgi:chromosome segregation ATPase
VQAVVVQQMGRTYPSLPSIVGKQLRSELTEMHRRLQELEAGIKIADKEKAVEVDRVRTDLEGKLRAERSAKEDLNRKVQDHFTEITQLREKNHNLEIEMAKVARVGKIGRGRVC